jgi:hypothetical protein
MASEDEAVRRFALQPTILRRQQRILRYALACYVPGGLILTGLTAWAAGQPAAVVAATLIGLSAVHVDYYAFVAVVQARLLRLDQRRAGTANGEFVLDGEGMRDGVKSIMWRDVATVRLNRNGVPHVEVIARRSGGRRRRLAPHNARYGVSLDELGAAFERFVPVIDPGRPREPVRDDQADTVTFFVNQVDLRAVRRRYLRSLWQLPVMLCPAIAGLFLLRQDVVAILVLAVLSGLLVLQSRKMRKRARPLRLSRNGRGRLLLTPKHITLAGTDVAIPWTHIHGAAVNRTGRAGLDARVECPESEPSPGCRFRGRTIAFHIADSLYNTTADDIGVAFARYIHVDGLDSPAAAG